MKNLVIRRAEIADADLLARLVAALSAAEGEPAPRFDAAICRRDGFGPSPLFTAWLAELDGKIAGYALHHRSYDTDRVVRAEWLGDLYVESWARGRGVGYRLAQFVARQAAEDGADALHWTVLRNNEPARAFYRRFATEDTRLLHCLCEGDNLTRLAATLPVTAATMRPAGPGDAPLLARMIDGLLASLGEPQFDFDASPRLLRDGFGPIPRFEAIIAEQDGEPVGYALFWAIYDTELGAACLFLSDLMVVEKARGRGIARDLMVEVARRTIAGGMPRLLWEVLEGNTRARALYRRIAREYDDAIVVNCADENFRRLIAAT